MRIGEMPWTEVREAIQRGAAALVPLGSIEEHGPHSPMGDYMAIHDIAGRTGEAAGDLVVPTMPFGYSEYFRHYPGTITLRAETLSAVVGDPATRSGVGVPSAIASMRRRPTREITPGGD